MGYNSQKLIEEQLDGGTGVGVVLSPRYLKFEAAREYAQKYRAKTAEILFDPEFYVPDSAQGKLGTYPSATVRDSVSALQKISDNDLDKLAKTLEDENRSLATTAVIAPAVPYEASRSDLAEFNQRLFNAAKKAGDTLGVPTFATVVVGQSATTTHVVADMLSAPTSLAADGWYFQYEFEEARLPKNAEEIYRFCMACLTLACTDKPVLHSSAGPMSLLSFAVGATGFAITFRQNLWGFDRSKWLDIDAQGGGGAAPARFFSTSLWGTIVQPDEVVLLPSDVRNAVLTHSPYSTAVATSPSLAWNKWNANKHFVHVVADATSKLAAPGKSRDAANAAIEILTKAISLHSRINAVGLHLKDETASYQEPWRSALTRALSDNADDYQWLEALGR